MTNPGTNRARDFAIRLNNLMNEIAAKNEDVKELKKEAAGEGYDAPALHRAVRLLRKDKNKRDEEKRQLDLYLDACDGLDFTA